MITIIHNKNHEQWLNARHGGIGSSEIGTLMGVNPYETPYQLWRRKVGIDSPKEENFAMKAGHYLEDAVSKFWSDATGKEVIASSSEEFVILNSEKSHFRVSPDRFYWIDDNAPKRGKISYENKGILECKTTQKAIDADNVPKYWFCQLQYQLGVSELNEGSIAWLISGRDFGYKNYVLVPEFFEKEKEVAERFWIDNVLGKKEPEMASAEDIVLKYEIPQSDKSVIADCDMTNKITQLKELKSSISELEAKAKECEDSIKIYFADAEKITNNIGDVLATWKGSTLSKFDSKKFKEENPDLYEKYVKPVSIRRFLLK